MIGRWVCQVEGRALRSVEFIRRIGAPAPAAVPRTNSGGAGRSRTHRERRTKNQEPRTKPPLRIAPSPGVNDKFRSQIDKFFLHSTAIVAYFATLHTRSSISLCMLPFLICKRPFGHPFKRVNCVVSTKTHCPPAGQISQKRSGPAGSLSSPPKTTGLSLCAIPCTWV